MGFNDKIIGWYKENHRPLPWRETKNPYEIWVSEIILQQTRVGQGLAYYHRFLKKFPDLETLASASEDEVLNVWQGLGYYSRARNMLKTAKMIQEKHDGNFPSSYDDIIQLKGIGDYTASAIASFAFDLPHPVMDGNVMRFISRLTGILDPSHTSKFKVKIRKFLDNEIDKRNPGLFNQALMEFGANVCTSVKPGCNICLFRKECLACKHMYVDKIPVKEKRIKSSQRYFTYLVPLLREDNQTFTFLRKRSGNDIWRNLYEFPMIESEKLIEWDNLRMKSEYNRILGENEYKILKVSDTFQHVLSHRVLIARYLLIECSMAPKGYIKVKPDEINHYPIPKIMERIIIHSNITFQVLKD